MRLVALVALLLGSLGCPGTKSDCSQLSSGGTWTITMAPSQMSGCPSPSPIAVTLPVPSSGACAPGCTCTASWKAAARDVDQPVECTGEVDLTCGETQTACGFTLESNRLGSGSCTVTTGATACTYFLDTIAKP